MPVSKKTIEEQALAKLDKELTAQLNDLLPSVLERTAIVLSEPVTSQQSLHGKIGGKNDLYANVADDRFHDYRAFQVQWAKGMQKTYEKSKHECAVWDIVRLYKDDLCRKYILLFQERNFYRHYNERIRIKPDERLWEVWFGNQLCMGLLIAPVPFPDGRWGIDHSEIRRAPYNYWTLGHIFHTGGFINHENNKLYPVTDLDSLDVFYIHLISSLSNSCHEKNICSRYIDYLRNSTNPELEPFLIPEFHFEGPEKKCKYRLDFTILNPYTFKFTGFELSPSSTHIHVEKVAGKTQKQLNEELAIQWEKECDKRNDYYNRYGISCITFTDKDLRDPDKCFEVISKYLSDRPSDDRTLDQVIDDIKKITI